MKIFSFNQNSSRFIMVRCFLLLILLLGAGSNAYAKNNSDKEERIEQREEKATEGNTTKISNNEKSRLINEWGITYGAGSPFGATEWRAVKNSEFTQKFSQMWQLNLCHQFSAKDYGAAPVGYYYPSVGMYLQWMDYSHLRIRGIEPDFPASKTEDYGQVVSVGLTFKQYCWTQGKWRAHLNLENGAAYVFDPTFETGNWVTLATRWQLMAGLGFYIDREVKHGELSIGPHFTHLSNGGLGAYNTGINNFSLSLRYRHKTLKEIQQCKKEEALINHDGTPFLPHFYGTLTASLGGVYYEYSEHANGQLTLSADAMYQINPNNGLGLGIDYFHNAQPDRTDHRDYLGMGIKYDRWFGPFVVLLQGGVYLNERRPIKWKGMSRFYENIGFKYVMFRTRHASPHIGIYTKGNGFDAEQLALSFGITFQGSPFPSF